jgi:hypothetical protein
MRYVGWKAGDKNGTVTITLLSPGVRRGAIATAPRRLIHIHARNTVTVLHLAICVLPKHDDLLPTHAKWLLGIRMQGAPDAMDVRENDVGAPPVRVYEYTFDLAKTLEEGADVGLERVWR